MKADESRTPMPNLNYLVLAAAVLLSGCASGPKPEPAAPASAAKDTRPASELVARGREAAARGDAVRAEQYLSLAIEQGADRRQVMPLLLEACLKSSHLRAALNHAEPYLLDHPEDDSLRYLVATIHLGLGQVVPAKRELGLLLQRNPSNADAHYLLGIIESGGNVEAARTHFLAVLAHSKDQEQKIEVESRLAELRLRERELTEQFGSTNITLGAEL
jgi:Flp pilus assembly protein TadD